MRLICCEMARIVGLGAVALESGAEVEKIRKFLVGKGVKPAPNTHTNSRLLYLSIEVQKAFEDVKKPLTNTENGV